MHELSVAQNIVSIVREHLEAGEMERVRTVRVKVGAFSTIVPKLLHSGFEAAVSDTGMSRAVLDIEIVPLRITCNHCSTTRDIEPTSFACPECGSADVEIESGRELIISDIELEDPISINGAPT